MKEERREGACLDISELIVSRIELALGEISN
jgi:hypothetical protein